MYVQVNETHGVNTRYVAAWEVIPAVPATEDEHGSTPEIPMLVNLTMAIPGAENVITLRGDEAERFLQALPVYRPGLDDDEGGDRG